MPELAPETFLAERIATALHGAGLGEYRADGSAYPTGTHGIFIDQETPTTVARFTGIHPLSTLSEGRTERIYRLQLVHRLIAADDRPAIDVARSWVHAVADLFHHRAYTPPVLGISWAEEYSRLDPFPDTQDRVTVIHNFSFRGRRP